MPNWMSDEDMGLDSGDLIRCEHCGKVYSVDDWHSCSEGADASRRDTETFTKNYFGDGTLVARRFEVTIVAPNTPSGFQDALDDLALEGEQIFARKPCSRSDDILQWAWEVKPL